MATEAGPKSDLYSDEGTSKLCLNCQAENGASGAHAGNGHNVDHSADSPGRKPREIYQRPKSWRESWHLVQLSAVRSMQKPEAQSTTCLGNCHIFAT